ncbi:hypothetical protein [Coprobacter sp.]
MNKILKTIGFTFSAVSLILLTGCIGDKGNTTQSSGVGTILVSNGIPYIKLDNPVGQITGNGISIDDRNKRVFCSYLINWDNQPNGSTIYQAELSDLTFWEIKNYALASSPEITIKDSDPLNHIADIFITKDANDYGDNIITFRTLTYKTAEGGTSSTLKLVEKLPTEGEEVDNGTKTMMLIFEEGTINQDATEVNWRSFTLPREAGIKNIVLQFKSRQRPSGSVFTVKDEDGNIIENAFYITLPYSTETTSTTTE